MERVGGRFGGGEGEEGRERLRGEGVGNALDDGLVCCLEAGSGCGGGRTVIRPMEIVPTNLHRAIADILAVVVDMSLVMDGGSC